MMIQVSNELIKDGGVDMPKGLLANGSAEIGVIAQAMDAIAAEEIISLYYSLDEKYRQNAVFMIHEDTAKALRLLKDEHGHSL